MRRSATSAASSWSGRPPTRRLDSAPTATTSGTEVVALAPGRARRFGTRVLEWGAQHRRDLPWRHTRDPWKILVSEVMLQQTQVDRVVPYYEHFVVAYPTPAACASTDSADVVRRWSGLGYNRRALNLHRAARSIVDRHHGQVPATDAELRDLPGVGVYNARAVRSFGFGEDVAAVDTNGVRVLARAVAGSRLTATAAFALGDRLVPRDGSWEFNQSMFDLGATVCTARPDCALCPLRRQCAWRRGGGGDPWRASPAARPQSAFSGSDCKGRGRLLESLRRGDVPVGAVASACGWPDDVVRSERIAAALVYEGFAEWNGNTTRVLRLR